MVKIKKDEIIGKSEDNAINELKENNIKYRIIKKDNEDFIVTLDYDKNRFNLEIEAGMVVNVVMG